MGAFAKNNRADIVQPPEMIQPDGYLISASHLSELRAKNKKPFTVRASQQLLRRIDDYCGRSGFTRQDAAIIALCKLIEAES